MLRQMLRLAVRSLQGHPLRALLAVVGVAVGVVLICTVVIVGAGFESRMVNDMRFSGARAIQFSAGSRDNLSFQWLPLFDAEDVQAVSRQAHVAKVVPIGAYLSPFAPAEIKVGGGATRRLFGAVIATEPGFFSINEFAFESGRPCRPGEAEIVLGASIAERLHAAQGQYVTLTLPAADIAGRFEVVGILTQQPDNPFGSMQKVANQMVAIPITWWAERYGGIVVEVDDVAAVPVVERAVVELLSQDSAVSAILSDCMLDIVGVSQEALIALIHRWLGMIRLAVLVLALLSMAIGGLNIANTMIMNVSERVRDIGVLKALGASAGQMAALFVSESVLIGCLGSLLGTVVGVGLAAIACWATGFPVTVPAAVVAGGLLAGGAAGALFGLYPAVVAMRVGPAEAIRTE